MKIDFNTELKDLTGEVYKHKENETTKLKDIVKTALNNLDKEQATTPEEIMKRFELMKKVFDSKEPITLKAEEIVLIKKQIAKTYLSAELIGICYNLLEK